MSEIFHLLLLLSRALDRKEVNSKEAARATITREQYVKITTYALDNLLKGYDKSLRPSQLARRPMIVRIDMAIRSMGHISETDMSYSMDAYFRQTWRDDRLQFNSSLQDTLSLGVSMLDKIWKPDSYFWNGQYSYLHTLTGPNKFVRLSQDGTVHFSQRLITQEINNISTFPVTWLQCRQKWANLKRDAKARQKRVLGRNDDGSLPIQQGEVEDCINWDEVNDLASRGGQSGSKPGFSLFNEVERLMKLEEAAGISVPKKQQQQRQSLPAIMPPPDQQMMQIPSTLPNQPPSPSHVFTSIQQSSTIQESSPVSLPQTVEQATALFNGGLAEPVQTQRVNRIAELLGRRKRKPAVSVSTLHRIANGFQPEKRPHQLQSPANSPSTSSEDSATLGVLQQIRDEMRSTRQDQREFLQTLMTESSIQAQAQADRDKTLISLLQGLLGTVNKAVGLITG